VANCENISKDLDAAQMVNRLYNDLAKGIGVKDPNQGKPGSPPLTIDQNRVDALLRLKSIEFGLARGGVSVAENVHQEVLKDQCVSEDERVAIHNLLFSTYGVFSSKELTDNLVKLLAYSYHPDSTDPKEQKKVEERQKQLSGSMHFNLGSMALARAVVFFFGLKVAHLPGTADALSRYMHFMERAKVDPNFLAISLFKEFGTLFSHNVSAENRADAHCRLDRGLLIVGSHSLLGQHRYERNIVDTALKSYRTRCPKHRVPPLKIVTDFKKQLENIFRGQRIPFSQFAGSFQRWVSRIRSAKTTREAIVYLKMVGDGGHDFVILWNNLADNDQMAKPIFDLTFEKTSGIGVSVKENASGKTEVDKLHVKGVGRRWVPNSQAIFINYMNRLYPDIVKLADWLMDDSNFQTSNREESRQWSDVRQLSLANICGKVLFYSNHFDDVIKIQKKVLSMGRPHDPMSKIHYYLAISHLAYRDWSAVKEHFQAYLDGVELQKKRTNERLWDVTSTVTDDVARKMAYGGRDGPELIPSPNGERDGELKKQVVPELIQITRNSVKDHMSTGIVQQRDLDELELMAHYFIIAADWHLARGIVSDAGLLARLQRDIKDNRDMFLDKYEFLSGSDIDKYIGKQFNYEQAYEDLLAGGDFSDSIGGPVPFMVGFNPNQPIVPATPSIQPLSPLEPETEERAIKIRDYTDATYIYKPE
jgi:hypothetical protein